MLSPLGIVIVFTLVFGLGMTAVVVSVLILRRGKFYDQLKPESRPRRWVLFLILILFAVFIVWTPIWAIWPHAFISRALTALFGITFFVVGITFKWLSPLVDMFIKRKGWPLR